MIRNFRIALWIVLLILLPWSILRDVVVTNLLGLKTARVLFSSNPPVDFPHITSDACRAKWISGLLFNTSNDIERRNANWIAAGSCDPNFIVLMHRLTPQDISLATQIQQKISTSAEAWFWLGDLTPEHAVEFYQRGLELSPMDAHRWMTLASLVEPVDPQVALDALVQACEFGDPGANACYGAGNRYLAMGDTLSAIHILRKATWQGSLDLADRLEQEVNEVE